MSKNISKVLLFLIIVMIAAAYPMNLNAFLSNTAEDFQFYYSSAYILVWLLFMFAGMKTKSKAFSNVYLIFWTLSVIYFSVYNFLLGSPVFMALYVTVPVFILPIMGFDFVYSILQHALRFDFLYSSVTLPFLVISLIMLLAGIAARRRRRKKALS